jgi:4'-phosphopantetheinyl transferase
MTTSLPARSCTAWNRPEGLPVLDGGEVHVWCANLEEAASVALRLERLLSEDERRRAAAFYFEEDRRRFMMARGVLRELLGSYLHIAPAALRFALDAYGKPRLAHPTGFGEMHFNVAHSHTLALYAMAQERAVGVDVEQVRAEFPYEDIAAQFFSCDENAALRALPPCRRPHRFFFYWTCKEAYLKAIGMGLGLPLESIHVDVGSEGGPARVQIEGKPGEGSQWSILPLRPSHGYTGAIAVRGKQLRLTCWRWSPAYRA